MLHFADFHLGMENHGRIDPETGLNSRIRDFIKRLDSMVDYARQHDVDLVVFAGDAFKNRLPNPTIQREFAWRVRDLSEMARVILLIGNHDVATSDHRASSLDIYDTLGVPNVTVGDNYKLHHIQTKRGPAFVGTAPYPIRSRLLKEEETHGKSITDLDDLLAAYLVRSIAALADEARAADPPDAPRVLTGHFTVTNAQLGSERAVMVGRDVTVPLGDLDDPVWDYVALGHIHRHQNLTAGRKGATPVVYSGSLERVDFSEEHEDKGFCWVELARGATRWQFVPSASRPFVTLKANVRDSADPMPIIFRAIREADVEEAVVRLVVEAAPEAAGQINERAVYRLLEEAGAHTVAAIEKRVAYEDRTRLGQNYTSLTPTELLQAYFRAKGHSPAHIEKLMALAAPLMTAED